MKIFEAVWGSRREAVLEACRMLSTCYQRETADPTKLNALDKRIDGLNEKLNNLILMKASNQITLKQFLEQSNEISAQQSRATREREELLARESQDGGLDIDAIEASLREAVTFTDGKVSEWFIQTFVKKVVPMDGTRFAWVLDLAPQPQTVFCEATGRKEYPRISLESNLFPGAWPDIQDEPPDRPFLLDREGNPNGDISAAELEQGRQPSRTPGSNPIGLMQLTLHFEDAHAFQKARNCVVKPSRWHDIELEVYL